MENDLSVMTTDKRDLAVAISFAGLGGEFFKSLFDEEWDHRKFGGCLTGPHNRKDCLKTVATRQQRAVPRADIRGTLNTEAWK